MAVKYEEYLLIYQNIWQSSYLGLHYIVRQNHISGNLLHSFAAFLDNKHLVNTTAQHHSTKSKLKIRAGSNLLVACQIFAMVRIIDNSHG